MNLKLQLFFSHDVRNPPGGVESPVLFALISDLCFQEAARKCQWTPCSKVMAGLCIRHVLYMDDSVLWDVDDNLAPDLGKILPA